MIPLRITFGKCGAMFRAREAKAAPIRKRLSELDQLIGPITFFVPRPMTATDRIIAKRFKNCVTASFAWCGKAA